jgi:hypothetical protein
MPDVDVVFRPTARRFYNEVATAEERQQINAIVNALCEAPGTDERSKYRLGTGEALYHDGSYWILYRSINNWTIEIVGIGTVSDDPPAVSATPSPSRVRSRQALRAPDGSAAPS